MYTRTHTQYVTQLIISHLAYDYKWFVVGSKAWMNIKNM